ncbi:hypothetical protein [Streptomyces sp. GESEQ-35]|uniref:hypothetical protein n=1 Tax=Streptomyces sp. GESEQ-35 TaxID=2812657 RepID=UPI001B320019|nr:hypothetical protein [Streptomyces sp. GESEQ-35]
MDDDDDRALLRRAVISSNVRLRKYYLASQDFKEKRKVRLAKMPVAIALVALFAVPFELLSYELTGIVESSSSFIATAVFVISISLFPIFWKWHSSFNFKVERLSGGDKRRASLVIFVIDVALFLFGVALLAWQLWFDESDALLVSPSLAAFLGGIFLINSWLSDSLITLLLFPLAHRVRPLDRALIDIVRVASYADLWKFRWYDAPRSRALVSELEAAAKRVEAVAWRTRRVGLLDRQARAEYRRDLLALASEIRACKRLIIRANNASGFSAAHSSLVRLALMLVKGDWDVILESADVSLVSRALLVWRKVFPSVCLLFGAFAIPLLPGVKESPELALSARVMLIATAVLYLVLPADSPAAGRILDVLGKSIK